MPWMNEEHGCVIRLQVHGGHLVWSRILRQPRLITWCSYYCVYWLLWKFLWSQAVTSDKISTVPPTSCHDGHVSRLLSLPDLIMSTSCYVSLMTTTATNHSPCLKILRHGKTRKTSDSLSQVFYFIWLSALVWKSDMLIYCIIYWGPRIEQI